MNFFFGQSAELDIVFDGSEQRKLTEIKTEDSKKEKSLLFFDGETVSGKVNVTLKKPGSKLEHQGIKIEFIGLIELYYDRGNHYEFTSLVRELARPGDLIQNTSYPFSFDNVEKIYEVYVGSNVRLRYFLRVTIVRRISDVVREIDIAVHTLCSYPEINSPIKMEVGIEDCLHIEFEYNKSKYHLKDVIVGKIYFLLVRIKIKHMEIAIIKRETTGSGPNTFTENETIAKYEIMDGAPVRGESIPIRVFLAGYDLTPTMRDINKKFSVRYFLNLVLMDTEDRRYFKQQEITLWRKADKIRTKGTDASLSMQSSGHFEMPSQLLGDDEDIKQSALLQHENSQERSQQKKQGQVHRSTTQDIDNGDLNNQDSPIDDSPAGTDPTMGLFTQESSRSEIKILTKQFDASRTIESIKNEHLGDNSDAQNSSLSSNSADAIQPETKKHTTENNKIDDTPPSENSQLNTDTNNSQTEENQNESVTESTGTTNTDNADVSQSPSDN